MEIKNVSVDLVVPYEHNPRINEKSIAEVAKSITEFGWQQPIVVDKNNVIVVGHTRFAAALSLGMEKVPVTVADGLSETQVKAYRLADNKVADYSIWDNKLLLQELDDIQKSEEDVFTGFYESDIFKDVLDETDNDVIENPSEEMQKGEVFTGKFSVNSAEKYAKIMEIVNG